MFLCPEDEAASSSPRRNLGSEDEGRGESLATDMDTKQPAACTGA